jgi:hypothetical protein
MDTNEQLLTRFDRIGKRAFYRPSGHIEAGYLVDLITFVLLEAVEQSLSQAVISIVRVNGFESPGPSFRRWAVGRWAEAVAGRISVAVVAKEQHICPEKTGLLVAAEEGLSAAIFTTETEALSWLNSIQGRP